MPDIGGHFHDKEMRGPIAGKVVTFVGDGACNVPRSWIFAAAKSDLNCVSPRRRNSSRLRNLERAGGKIICTDDLKRRRGGADLLYTDVWVSMGKESESAERLKIRRATRSTKDVQTRQTERAGDALPARVSRQRN